MTTDISPEAVANTVNRLREDWLDQKDEAAIADMLDALSTALTEARAERDRLRADAVSACVEPWRHAGERHNEIYNAALVDAQDAVRAALQEKPHAG